MYSEIQTELVLLMNIDNIKANEQIKILAIISNVLANKEYLENVKNGLDKFFTEESSFDGEFSRLVMAIIELNQKCQYYKNIDFERCKFVIYSVLYNFLIKNKIELLCSIEMQKLRMLYFNAWDLIKIIPESVKVLKNECDLLCGLFSGPRKITI
jgi:hypothetical protein